MKRIETERLIYFIIPIQRWEFIREKSKILKPFFFLVEILVTLSFLGQDRVFFLHFLVKIVFFFLFS